MRWHEDFGDEPSVEERTPYGLSPTEMQVILVDASLDACERCGERFPVEELITTGMYEYCTMDIDPDSKFCPDCYESHRQARIPGDPSLFDGLTPVFVA